MNKTLWLVVVAAALGLGNPARPAGATTITPWRWTAATPWAGERQRATVLSACMVKAAKHSADMTGDYSDDVFEGMLTEMGCLVLTSFGEGTNLLGNYWSTNNDVGMENLALNLGYGCGLYEYSTPTDPPCPSWDANRLAG